MHAFVLFVSRTTENTLSQSLVPELLRKIEIVVVLELIEGFRLACQRHGIRNMQLVIVGRAYHAHYYRRIQALLDRLGIRDGEVLLTGEIPHEHVGHLLGGCDVYVFPSTCENCPTSLLEALAMGVPIACSRVGVMPEIAGEAALYFDPDDVEDIARRLGELMTNPDLRHQLRGKALEQARRFPGGAEVARRILWTLEQAKGGSDVERWNRS